MAMHCSFPYPEQGKLLEPEIQTTLAYFLSGVLDWGPSRFIKLHRISSAVK
jgi:hypothetical protein